MEIAFIMGSHNFLPDAMNLSNHTFRLLTQTTLVALLLSLALTAPASSKNPPPDNHQKNLTVNKVRIGPHPKYTRILIDLSQPAAYKVNADFVRKKVTLTLKNAQSNPRLQTRSIKDRNIEKIAIHPQPQNLEIVLHLRRSNTRFFHYLDRAKSQIVIDFNSVKKPILQTQIGERQPGSEPQAIARTEVLLPRRGKTSRAKSNSKPSKKVRVAGMTPRKIKQVHRQDIENKLKDGWDEYQSALKEFQEKNYPKAIESFEKFIPTFPDSKYLAHIYYLMAEAHFQIAFRQPHPIYENALAAYKNASRRFPKSRFTEHALDKIAFIYSELGYILEAKTMYEESLKTKPKSPYLSARKNNVALMMLKEGKLEEAYTGFKRLLEKNPKNIAARSAIFEIANSFYQQKNFNRALEIYQDGAARWPNQLNEDPDINYNMGDIYFRQKQYTPARAHLYDLINLAPDHEHAHKALNMIGDSYLLKESHNDALAVFDESAKRNSGSSESLYGKIRMADIGVINPKLKVKDIIYHTEPYYQPFKAYDEVLQEANDVEILAEVTLSRGIAFLKEQNYLWAIEEFKKLLPLGPDSRFYNKSQTYIQQALVHSVDKYARQGGVLPILYSYSDFSSLSLGEVKNLKTVMQIGEAYQSIGMFPQALRFYERVKKLDAKNIYRDRIFLNLGQIHLDQNNFKEAELVAQSFLKNYPQSPQVLEALKLLASSHSGRKQYNKALRVYKKLLTQPGGNISETHTLLAETHQNLGNLSSAINEYRQAIKTFDRKAKIIPNNIRKAYYSLGFTLFQDKKYAQAAKALEAARKLFPEQPHTDWADYLLVESYNHLKNPSKATATLNTLIESKDTNDLLKQAAESKLKVLDWEKEFKDTL
jgi:TolA-binding protein